MTYSIAIIEDDERLSEFMMIYLEKNGYKIFQHFSGDNAKEFVINHKPDLIILDVMLPGTDGLTLCKELRPIYTGKIIILTANNTQVDEIIGLELGADDYLQKPIEPRLLLARIRAHLRISSKISESTEINRSIQTFGVLSINKCTREVTLHGKHVEVSSTEFELLWLLAINAGTVLSRDAIMTNLRGIDYNGFDRSIDARISRLRKILNDTTPIPTRIKTVRGKGYLFTLSDWD